MSSIVSASRAPSSEGTATGARWKSKFPDATMPLPSVMVMRVCGPYRTSPPGHFAVTFIVTPSPPADVRNDSGVNTGGAPHGVTYSGSPPSAVSASRVVPGTMASGPVGAKPVIVVAVIVTRRSPTANVNGGRGSMTPAAGVLPIVDGGTDHTGAPPTRSRAVTPPSAMGAMRRSPSVTAWPVDP